MNHPLPPDIEERLKARMSEGQYASEAELLRNAMDALDRLEEDRLLRWRDRNRLAIEQSQQGKSRPLNDCACPTPRATRSGRDSKLNGGGLDADRRV
jgi:Arc/MetJ-type ribon-helix-helix transcriptional regulator